MMHEHVRTHMTHQHKHTYTNTTHEHTQTHMTHEHVRTYMTHQHKHTYTYATKSPRTWGTRYWSSSRKNTIHSQWFATSPCCSVLQCVAVCCNVFQNRKIRSIASGLRSVPVAVCCSVLQCVAVQEIRRQILHMNVSCHTYEWVMSHTWM